jgi:phosphate starvation-inducible PhoH-like protein
MAKSRNTPRRESKKLSRHELEEVAEYKNSIKSVDEFIGIRRLDFELTDKQKKLMTILDKNKIITVTGPPGTSKTFIACYAAMQALLAGKCKKIILSKPTEVLSGTKDPGALPGTIEEKMAVYAESFIDSFEEFLSPKDFKYLWDEKLIEFKPAQFLRGRSLKDSYIIIDEFQNFDIKALKSIVTRLGRNSKIVFMGDTRQNDINKKYVAVDTFIEIISPIDGCDNFKFERGDIVREQILIDIIDRFEKFEDENLMPRTIKNT